MINLLLSLTLLLPLANLLLALTNLLLALIDLLLALIDLLLALIDLLLALIDLLLPLLSSASTILNTSITCPSNKRLLRSKGISWSTRCLSRLGCARAYIACISTIILQNKNISTHLESRQQHQSDRTP